VNGVYNTKAQDQATGREQSMTIHPSGGLSQQEVSRLVDETRAREIEERDQKELDTVVRQVEGLVANTMRSVQALEGKLSKEEQENILQSIEKAKKAVAGAKDGDGNTTDELKTCLTDMEKAATVIGQAMLRP
jgi:molecular chaperone DnaK